MASVALCEQSDDHPQHIIKPLLGPSWQGLAHPHSCKKVTPLAFRKPEPGRPSLGW